MQWDLIPNPIKKFLIGGILDMNNFREVNDDMLKDWLEFRDQTVLAYTTKEDKKHTIEFDEIFEKILNSVPKQNRSFIQKQFNQLIGMRSIIEMDFVMECNLLLNVLMNSKNTRGFFFWYFFFFMFIENFCQKRQNFSVRLFYVITSSSLKKLSYLYYIYMFLKLTSTKLS